MMNLMWVERISGRTKRIAIRGSNMIQDMIANTILGFIRVGEH